MIRRDFIKKTGIATAGMVVLPGYKLSRDENTRSSDSIDKPDAVISTQSNNKMERLSFLNQSTPVIAGIIAGQTPQELMTRARESESKGAKGITIDLHDLKPEFRNTESFKRIINSVNLPFMFYFYRYDKWKKSSDDERQEVLLAAAEAGASMIDVMGDLYDPSPREITRDPRAIDKQKRLIDEIHDKGADVVLSTHTGCPMTTEEVIEHMMELEARGPEVVKIVTTVNTEAELAEALRTTIMLNSELKIPFIHLCTGKYGRPHRYMCPVLGTSILFAIPSYSERYQGLVQPTIESTKAVMENINWNIKNVR